MKEIILNLETKNPSSPKIIKIQGKTITDNNIIAQSFKHLFYKYWPEFGKKIPETNKCFLEFLNLFNKDIEFKELSFQEVFKRV